MKKIFAALTLLLVLGSAALAENTFDLIKQADALYSSREIVSNAEKSLVLYEKAASLEPSNYEANWKVAQVCKYLGDRYPGDEKLPILEVGEKYVKKAVEISPEGVDGHFWLGVTWGRIGEERGVLNSLFLVGPIKDEMEKVLQADPKHDGAHHVLSVLYRKAPGWPLSLGDINKALEYAKLSVEEGPDRTLNHLGLAEVYISMDRNAEAKEELLKVINMPSSPDRIPESKDDKDAAKALLVDVNKKLNGQ